MMYEITIMKNNEDSHEELFWQSVNEDVMIHILLGITNALVEELDDRHE